jgi:hypothetical protein
MSGIYEPMGYGCSGIIMSYAVPDLYPQPKKPKSIGSCEYCGSQFFPEEEKFTCPKCGAHYREKDRSF